MSGDAAAAEERRQGGDALVGCKVLHKLVGALMGGRVAVVGRAGSVDALRNCVSSCWVHLGAGHGTGAAAMCGGGTFQSVVSHVCLLRGGAVVVAGCGAGVGFAASGGGVRENAI